MSRTLPLPGRTLPERLNDHQYCSQCAACVAPSLHYFGARPPLWRIDVEMLGLCGSSPSWRSRAALLRIAERWRRNRLAICEAEFVGHKVTSSRSSSSVQRVMAGLGMVAPAPGAITADSCGAILVIASFFTAARLSVAHHLAWRKRSGPINHDAPY